MKWDIYITAVKEDKEITDSLADSLRNYRLPANTELPDPATDFRRICVDIADKPLDDSIRAELDDSRYLVIICSPDTKDDPAVNERLDYFREKAGKDSIIAVIVRGEPAEAFPPSFIEHEVVQYIMPDMTVVERTETIEPVAADLRADTPARRKQLLRYETVRITASVLGLHPDALEQRHRARARRTARTILSAAAVICLSTAGIFLRLGQIARAEGRIAEQQTQLSIEIAQRTMNELPERFKDDPAALVYIDEAVQHARESLYELGLEDLLDGEEGSGS